MIFDKQAQFSNAQDLQGLTGSQPSEQTIDLGTNRGADLTPAQYQIGKGKPVRIRCQVTETFVDDSGTNGTVNVQLQTDGSINGSSQLLSGNTIAETGAIAVTALVQGYEFDIDFVPKRNVERYIALNYVIATMTPTAGKITAGIVLDEQQNHFGE